MGAICAAVSSASAQQQQGAGADTRLPMADSAFARHAWQSAADGYRAVVKDTPSNGVAWFRLASSLDQLGKTDDAIAAYSRAIDIGAQPAMSQFRLARLYAQQHKNSETFDHLQKFAAFGADSSMLANEPAFASLRGTAEFASALKTALEARYPCRNEHTFDFWVGDFDTGAADPNAPPTGELHNTREYQGCVILERFAAKAGGGAGMSMAFYDANRHTWRMIWNDDSNSSNDFEGSYHDGAMRFEGWVLDAQGNKMLARNVLENVSPDVIRHQYSTSPDNGKTWVMRSNTRFVRKKN